jgi:hypothetical protein
MSKIKDAALEVLSKGKTLEEATEGFSVDELYELAYVLEKAKFISPEQQKANRLKAIQEGNKAAFEASRLAHKAPTTQGSSDFKHLPTSSPVMKRPDDALSIATSSDGDFHENQAIAHERAGNHEVARAHYALSSNAAGSPDQGLLSDSEIRHHQKTIKAFHSPSKRDRLKVVKAELEKAMNKQTNNNRYGRPNPDVDVKEVLKTDKNGQWSLDKAIKPGPTLDYTKINPKPDYKEMEAKAPTIDYQNNSATKKPVWSGAADQAKAVREKINTEANETAVETIRRRQDAKKSDGVNVEPELTSDQKKRMVAKNEMMGYGQDAVMQSEAEPHKDDPHHEEKEKKKAKKIKEEAEKLLDMHKD